MSEIPDTTPASPGRVACEAWWTRSGLAAHPEYMGHDAEYRNSRASWDASAQAVLNQAFPGLKQEVTEARAELRSIAAELESWPRCPDGCGCRMGTDDADRAECGCDGPCTAECRENGYPDAPSYRDAAVKHVMDERDEARAVVAEMCAHWERIGTTREEDERIPGWRERAGLEAS